MAEFQKGSVRMLQFPRRKLPGNFVDLMYKWPL